MKGHAWVAIAGRGLGALILLGSSAVACAQQVPEATPTEVAGTQAGAQKVADANQDKPGLMTLLHDPQDHKFDMSRWLLEHKGFLPVPIVISDPAVGYGGGVALAFFHKPKGQPLTRTTSDGRQQLIPPNIFGAMALKTENGSHAYGAGAMLHFKEDRWRYTGGLVKASFNLDFYTPGTFIEALPIGYNVDGLASFQKVSRRLGSQDLYLGLSWTYMDLDLAFDVDSDSDRFSDVEKSDRSSGLGLSLEYDQRDNPFTPSSGWLGMIEGNFYGEGIGGDTTFQSYRAHTYVYWPLLDDRLILGGRLDARWANGDIPFYRLPYIDLRGIGSARYQDTRASTAETEVRYNLTQRWALIGFAGAGRTWGRRGSFSDATSQVAKGAGFRYLIARKLGLYTGLDYAWGPEDETFYIQVGSAWR
ncbi:BamA/TamA family outer membrane protein [Pseudoxanthomonas indica]|uniref:Surface antigen n=1 Tax=Pseudoxanthomonas indica TaxID=428993 RepID=A0A1T5JJH5_9GAMM|nr:BamA/TamA family outer membrane protein [Pseudoxanthomonas indica]GGD59071.1 glyceraldehyde-3-phosphate dehydrogenase [Pseudoxanthomonas indica]SKC51559.1 Surface antigen [Pseudoxanthomonas indica]